MATPVFINGQGGSFVWLPTGGSSQSTVCKSWTAKADVEILDTTNTGSEGWQDNINGIQKIEGSIKMDYDTANDQAATISQGATGTLTLPLGASGNEWSGSARIGSVSTENPAKGTVTFDVDFVSNGPWDNPS